jgi:hypothetical protein
MAPLGGGAPTTLESSPASPAIARDSKYVYWPTMPGGEARVALMRVPLAGGKPTQIALLGPGPVDALVADESGVYWGNGGTLGRFTPE